MKRTVLLLAAAVLLSMGAAFVVIKVLSKPAATQTAAEAAARPTPTAASDPGMVYPLPERVLNLAPSNGTPHYVRIQLAIIFARPPGEKPPKPAPANATSTSLEPGLAPVDARHVQIDDALVRVVGSKTFETLDSNDGREALKQELLAAVREIVPTPVAQGVYIVEMVVQ